MEHECEGFNGRFVIGALAACIFVWPRLPSSAMTQWDDIRFFLAVAREGSLTAAALVLGVTQPTAGRRISALEKRLGAKLFTSTPTGQVLSPTGKQLVSYAERMDDSALAVERLASGRDTGIRGSVRITASEWLVDRVLAPMVAPLLDRHPELTLDLVADARHFSLVRREADVALRVSRFEHQDIVERAVGVVQFGLYASDAYLARHGLPDFARQCEGHCLITMSEGLTKIPELDWLPRVAAKARVVARANGRLPMATLAARDIGMAFLPRFLGDATSGLRHLISPEPTPERRLWLAAHRDTRTVPRVKVTLATLTRGLAELEPLAAANLSPKKLLRG